MRISSFASLARRAALAAAAGAALAAPAGAQTYTYVKTRAFLNGEIKCEIVASRELDRHCTGDHTWADMSASVDAGGRLHAQAHVFDSRWAPSDEAAARAEAYMVDRLTFDGPVVPSAVRLSLFLHGSVVGRSESFGELTVFSGGSEPSFALTIEGLEPSGSALPGFPSQPLPPSIRRGSFIVPVVGGRVDFALALAAYVRLPLFDADAYGSCPAAYCFAGRGARSDFGQTAGLELIEAFDDEGEIITSGLEVRSASSTQYAIVGSAVSAVPEPAPVMLVAAGLAAVAVACTRRRRALVALTACAALTVSAAPAQAQLLKRIKQAARDGVAETVGRAAPNRADSARAAASEPKAPMPITAERLDVFLTAMRPAIAAAERGRAEFEARKAYDKARARYDAAAKQYETCSERIMERERPRLMALVQRDPNAMARLQGYLPEHEELYEAQRQAMARQDVARMTALGDSIAVLQRREFVRLVPALKDCGEVPRQPVEPKSTTETAPEQLIAPPAGMTRGQFGRLRERIAVYALTGGKEDPFTAEERAVLDARAADLAKLAPLFRDGLLEWGQWGQDSNLGRRWNPPAAGAEPRGS